MTTLLFQKTQAKLGSLELDVSVTEQHQMQVDVTEHPVESGASLVDHVRPKPEVLTLRGLVTNTPNNVDPDNPDPTNAERAGRALAQLRELKDSGTSLTVVTALRTYENMVLASVDIPRDASSGQALLFDATLREIRTATLRVVLIDDVGKPKKNRGTKPTKKADEQVDKKTLANKLRLKAVDAVDAATTYLQSVF